MKLQTLIVQAGISADKTFGAVSAPIYQTSTFRHPRLGQSTGFDYSRTSNPTRKILEDLIAAMEGGTKGFAFSSGLAAITAVMTLFKQGDHIIFSDDLYGGTYRLMHRIFNRFGLSASFVNTSDVNETSKHIKPGLTKAFFLETPSNPLLKITDIRKTAELAKRHGILTIVDNTLMTPLLQRPLTLGADIVVHSGTKFLGGHNDVLCGLVAVKDEALAAEVGFIQNATGGVLAPMDSWLLLRGVKTLAVRMEKAQSNALKIIDGLLSFKNVLKVYYPSLKEQEERAVHEQQSCGPGAMISFAVDDAKTAEKVINSVKLISFAESLGGVESLITYPAVQTHGDIPPDIRKKLGITDRLLRISVGIEDAGDILADLKQALEN